MCSLCRDTVCGSLRQHPAWRAALPRRSWDPQNRWTCPPHPRHGPPTATGSQTSALRNHFLNHHMPFIIFPVAEMHEVPGYKNFSKPLNYLTIIKETREFSPFQFAGSLRRIGAHFFIRPFLTLQSAGPVASGPSALPRAAGLAQLRGFLCGPHGELVAGSTVWGLL